eukprot:scaffold139_cov246-Pinguiococcus_pyrenoidosus.AAC.3
MLPRLLWSPPLALVITGLQPLLGPDQHVALAHPVQVSAGADRLRRGLEHSHLPALFSVWCPPVELERRSAR